MAVQHEVISGSSFIIGKVSSVFPSWFHVLKDGRHNKVTSDCFYPSVDLQHRNKLSHYVKQGDVIVINNHDCEQSEWVATFRNVAFDEVGKFWGIVEELTTDDVKIWSPDLGIVKLDKSSFLDADKPYMWTPARLVGRRIQLYLQPTSFGAPMAAPRLAMNGSLIDDAQWKLLMDKPIVSSDGRSTALSDSGARSVGQPDSVSPRDAVASHSTIDSSSSATSVVTSMSDYNPPPAGLRSEDTQHIIRNAIPEGLPANATVHVHVHIYPQPQAPLPTQTPLSSQAPTPVSKDTIAQQSLPSSSNATAAQEPSTTAPSSRESSTVGLNRESTAGTAEKFSFYDERHEQPQSLRHQTPTAGASAQTETGGANFSRNVGELPTALRFEQRGSAQSSTSTTVASDEIRMESSSRSLMNVPRAVGRVAERCSKGIITALRPDGVYVWSPTLSLFCRFVDMRSRSPWASAEYFGPFDVVSVVALPDPSLHQGYTAVSIHNVTPDYKNTADHKLMWKRLTLGNARVEEFSDGGRCCILSRCENPNANRRGRGRGDIYLGTSAFPCYLPGTMDEYLRIGEPLRLLLCENRDWQTLRRRPWRGLAIVPSDLHSIEMMVEMTSVERKQMMEAFTASALASLRPQPDGQVHEDYNSQPVVASSASRPRVPAVRPPPDSLQQAPVHAAAVSLPAESTVAPSTSLNLPESQNVVPSFTNLGMVISVGKDNGYLWCADYGILEFSVLRTKNLAPDLCRRFKQYQSVRFSLKQEESASDECSVEEIREAREEFMDIASTLRVVEAKVTNVLSESQVLLDVIPEKGESPCTIEADDSCVLRPTAGRGVPHVGSTLQEGTVARALICPNVRSSFPLFNATWKVLCFMATLKELTDIVDMNKRISIGN